ncbi:hypothetical protein PsorP6_016769 [Peronosclerospora sorghi]|uniref:Uncharacterized protein n=1 Tax=Peronosclerospora sorghi TaxID=230839 RepID=A0ACC0WBR9_9STRA|nr:hypothetical protein PsorP6_016769 [Peronosclerospora sorghi]
MSLQVLAVSTCHICIYPDKMKVGVFAAECACVLAIAIAQDVNTDGQAGSMTADIVIPPATSPTNMIPGMAAPAGVTPVSPAAVIPATQAPSPMGASSNPEPLADSGSGSSGSASDIEAPGTMKPKKVADSSGSHSNSPILSDDSRAPTTAAGAWMLMGLLVLGLVATL